MKIAILTNFTWIRPLHSLGSIVVDQATALLRHDHDVTIFVNEDFNRDISDYPPWLEEIIHPTFPAAKLIDYGVNKEYPTSNDITPDHERLAERISELLIGMLHEYDVIFTHDWVFTGWNLPYAKALLKAAPHLRSKKWMHWIHSVPGKPQDWWLFEYYGPGHRIVYPNSTDRSLVASQFSTSDKKVVVIPHIRDIRTMLGFTVDAWNFLDQYPEIMQNQIVQIYPASTDRLEAKRLREVILIFSKLKKLRNTVCLVCANQHADDRKRKEDIERYNKIASRNGLILGQEFIFTSEVEVEGCYPYTNGVPRSLLFQLMMCMNLFIYPTREESFGLVLPEACLLSGCLPVLNKTLRQQIEVGGLRGLYVDFGAFDVPMDIKRENDFHKYVSSVIMSRMIEDDGIQARTWHRTKYNLDSVYVKYYDPILYGSAIWE